MQVQELLDRRFDGAESVINCMRHMRMNLLDRPNDCKLCSADVKNRLANAIAANKWLGQWKRDAEEVIKSEFETPSTKD